MKHLKKFETFEINESVLGTIGAIALGIFGLRLIATIALSIFGVKKLKNMKGKEKLKELVNKFEKDYTKKKPNEKERNSKLTTILFFIPFSQTFSFHLQIQNIHIYDQ